jgi:SAM-dependent methyltransferase
MNWECKAAIMRLCTSLPFGDRLYQWGQKRFGRLKANPMERLPMQVEMARWLIEQGMTIEGSRFFEVGTGHIPLVPIGFFLSGAAATITVDLHRRIEWGLTRACLEWITSHRSEVEAIYGDVVPNTVFNERFSALVQCQSSPQIFLKRGGIEYLAPVDASHIHLPAQSVDCHFSVTVLEHIPLAVLKDIFTEAKRILTPTGIAIHFIDLSDHFQHQDKSISPINFLQFSDSEWNRIAGNDYAYCNRLRASDYLKLFTELGYVACKVETSPDPVSLHSLKNGFPLDRRFRSYVAEDLSVSVLRVMLSVQEG